MSDVDATSIVDRLRPPPGLRVLVSAGAAGIGAAIARAFHAAGARVCICDIDRAAVGRIATEVSGIVASVADAADRAQVDRVVEGAARAFGGLDVLVNNAGIAGPTGGIDELDPDDWQRTIDVDLNGQYYFARRAVPLLKASTDNPCVIAMSSVAGRLGYAWRTPYAAAKWAIVGMVKSLAIELGPAGIRANAILPGVVEGDRIDRVIDARARTLGVSFEAMRDEYLRKVSLRRMVSADDVAAMALFLSSPAARNVTGQAISVDGNVEYL
ncbi:MAG TPA: SDR family oxidoreductase [Casimicrobiaceae bacterium]|nr:SDR family oxidoreductase [Casimicrobiaceae bacterium]